MKIPLTKTPPRARVPAAACALLALAGVAWAAVHAGHWLAAAARPPERADAIAVLGGDSGGERVARALELYRDGIARNVVVIGPESGTATVPDAANARDRVLIDQGVPRENVRLERQPKDTYEEATRLLAVMRAEDWHRVVVISDPPHMRRVAWTCAQVFRGTGLSCVPVPSRPQWWNAAQWWRDRLAREFVASELVKLAYYVTIR